MLIKIDKKDFYKILRGFPNIERDFYKKLEKEIIKSKDYEGRNKIVLRDLKELRGAHLFISIAKKASIVTISFTKQSLLKNDFIEKLIVKSKYFDS